MYRIRPHDPMGKIIGTNQRTFQFALLTDPNIASIQFHAEHQDLPADRSLPIPQSRSRRKPVLSDRIPVHANSLDFPVEQTRGINWGDIFYKALQNGYWREHAGDNTPMGWFITGLYLAGVGICTLCVKRSRQHALSGTWFWWVCVLALLLLGINKQLDLQMLLADLGRTYARSHAWYSLRKPVQIQAVSISLALCLGMVEIILFKLRQQAKITWLALFGLAILALYFGLRMVSLHQVDKYVMVSCRGIALGSLIEIGGILCVSTSAIMGWLKYRRPRAQYILR
jgi:hypothetical protein